MIQWRMIMLVYFFQGTLVLWGLFPWQALRLSPLTGTLELKHGITACRNLFCGVPSMPLQREHNQKRTAAVLFCFKHFKQNASENYRKLITSQEASWTPTGSYMFNFISWHVRVSSGSKREILSDKCHRMHPSADIKPLGLKESGFLAENHCSLQSNRIVRMCFFHGTWNMIDQLVPKHL